MTYRKTDNENFLCGVKSRVYAYAAQVRQHFCLLLLAALYPLTAVSAAETTRPAYIPPPPAVSSGSIVQIIFSLLLVLAIIVLVAWLLKRANVAQHGSEKLLKVLGSVAIGQRERAVLVEIKGNWLVVGVGPGQIRTLHTLPKPVDSKPDTEDTSNSPDENKFAAMLASVLRSDRKRNAP